MVLCSAFWLAAIYNGFSQQAQFITANPNASLTTGQSARKVKFQNLSTTQSLQVVQLGNPTLQQQGVLSLQIPGNSTVHQFRARYVRVETNGDFIWIGDRGTQYDPENVPIGSPPYATITVMKKGIRMFGEMQIDALSYQIKDLGQGLNALILMKAPDGGNFCGTPAGSGTL